MSTSGVQRLMSLCEQGSTAACPHGPDRRAEMPAEEKRKGKAAVDLVGSQVRGLCARQLCPASRCAACPCACLREW